MKLFGRGSVPEGRKVGAIEVYDDARFFTVTGCHVPDTPDTLNDIFVYLADLWPRLEALRARRGNGAAGEPVLVDLAGDGSEVDVSAKLAGLLSKPDSAFARSWRHDRPDLADQSFSSYDLSLCTIAAARGWSDPELAALIAAHRGEHGDDSGKEHRKDYLIRTIARARAAAVGMADEPPARPQAEAPGAAPAEERRLIRVQGGSLADTTREAIAALRDADSGIYDRGGQLYRVVEVEDTATVAGVKRHRGALVLRPIVPEWIQLRLAGISTWERYDRRGKTWLAIDPVSKVADILVAVPDEGRWPFLRAIVRHPVLLPSGRVLSRPGYDPETRLLLDLGGGSWPEPPMAPTKTDAEAALQRLVHLLRNFRWATEKDRAVALSLLLTTVTRPGLPTAPLHAIDAPLAGSGKSLLIDAAAILATGEPASVMEFGEDAVEASKRLDSMLLAGDGFIALDNVEAPLEGVSLCQTLSQERREIRILGSSTRVNVSCAAMLTATGNNLIIRGDMVRRTMVCRIDPRTERPELRAIDQNLLAEVAEKRGELVRDCQTIILAYIRSGRENKLAPLGSFEVWSEMIREALVWVGCADPITKMDETRQGDPTRLSIQAVLTAWRDTFRDDAKTAAEAVRVAEHNEELREALEQVAMKRGRLDASTLGYWLRRNRDARTGELRLVVEGANRSKVQMWAVSNLDVGAGDAGDGSNPRAEFGK